MFLASNETEFFIRRHPLLSNRAAQELEALSDVVTNLKSSRHIQRGKASSDSLGTPQHSALLIYHKA